MSSFKQQLGRVKRPTSNKIRFSTLVRDFGPVTLAKSVSDSDWNRAESERRFATVYHGESDWCTPLYAKVGHHGYSNTICKIVFAKKLPENITEIVGMKNSDEAFNLCNPE